MSAVAEWRARLAWVALAAAMSVGCRERAPEPRAASAPTPRVVGVTRAAEVPLDGVPRPLRVVVTPVFAPRDMERDFAPLAAHLAAAIGTEATLDAPEGYPGTLALLERGAADLVQLPPLAYVLARERFPSLELLATNISEGASTYSGYLVVRAGSGLRTVEDLRGKVLGFVDPESTSGYLYPYAFLLDHGVDPERYFKRVVMSGRHDAALERLLAGQIDVAATFSGALLHAESRGLATEGLEIIAKTGRVPYDAWCVRGDLSRGVKERLRATMLSLSTRTPEGRRVLGPLRAVNGFAPATDAAYDEVRRVRRLVAAATE